MANGTKTSVDSMEIKRDIYLNRLINRKNNGMIKVVTGVRRSGKSYLLFHLFYNYLLQTGVDDEHIIKLALDDRMNKRYRNPDTLCDYVHQRIKDHGTYFILLDEVQFVSEFEDVLNSFLHIENADTYVTGSNAKFLSKDIITEFRGRGDEIRIFPLNFREFMQVYQGDKVSALDEYMTYGGLPQVVQLNSEEQRIAYLKNLFEETYITDIRERYGIKRDEELAETINIVASSIGGLVNPTKIANTFATVKQTSISRATVTAYLEYLCDSFLMEKALRYDVKGRKYIDTPFKCYFVDCGLRNARLNFRQIEMTHLMENVIYNELRVRGFNVDVGSVTVRAIDENGTRRQQQLEIDFVCNMGSKRYYIQSAYRLNSVEKEQQERASLNSIDDSFKKIVIVGTPSLVHHDQDGITTMSIYDFLLDENSLEL